MNSDAVQKNASISASNSDQKQKPWNDELVELSHVLNELKSDEYLEVLPLSKRKVLRKYLAETESILTRVGVTSGQYESNQEEQMFNKSVTELGISVAGLADAIKSYTDRRRRVLRNVGFFLAFLLVVEIVVWLLLLAFGDISVHSHWFVLLTFGLLPQVALADMALFWMIGRRIIKQWSTMPFRRKHI